MWRRRGGTGSTGEHPPDDEEHAIVLRALIDPVAFAPLYERYLDPVYRHCFRKLGNRAEAEDQTSEIFQKTMRALPTFHHGSFRAWIFTIAANHIRDYVRTVRPVAVLTDWDRDPSPGPDELAFRAHDNSLLRCALSQLESDQRSVVELRLDGFSHQEIAEILGRSHESVRQLQSRGIKRLRVVLGVEVTPEGTR